MTRLGTAGKFWLTYLGCTLLVIYMLLKAVGAFGSPFLTCDPQDRVEWYEVDGLGVDGQQLPVTASGDQSYLSHDLAGSIVGTVYNINVRACNVWGCSTPDVPFTFTPGNVPSGAAGLAIVP